MHAVRIMTVLALAATLAGCQVLSTLSCDQDLGMRLSPMERTLTVGESFTPSVAFFTCGGDRRLSDTFTWAADDTTVVSVHPATGRTTGRAPGQTRVTPTGERYGRLSSIQVTVRGAGE